MQERVDAELALIRRRYPDVKHQRDGNWLLIPSYPLPEGWNRSREDVATQVPPGYPGSPPYGIYVKAGLLFKGERPNNYTEPAGNRPPFEGEWGVFSWTPDEPWRPTADLLGGSNLLNWVIGFAERFRAGK